MSITSRFDHNRDGAVNALDLTVVRSNYSKRLDYYPPARATLPNPPQPPLLFYDTATSVLRDEPADA